MRQADTIPRLSGLERQQRAGVQQELVKAILPSVLVPALAAWICDVSSVSLCLCPDPEAVRLVPNHLNHMLLQVPWIFLRVGRSSG